jgi:hypothetical protein
VATATPSVRESAAPYQTSSALEATAWRRLLDASQLAGIPESPGVYLFRDADTRLLYVGKATSLRSRLAAYLGASFSLVRQMPGLVEATATLDVEPLPAELAARLREAELIAAERPPYNVQRRVEPALTLARLALDRDPARGTTSLAHVPRLVLRDDGPDVVLTTTAAASHSLEHARASWWPARPRADERPTATQVRQRLKKLTRAARGEMAKADLPGGLRAADLASGVLVVTPPRPVRTLEEPEEDPWTRERVDANWPPPVLSPPNDPEPAPVDEAPSLVALLVDPGGLRAAVPVDTPDAAREAIHAVPGRRATASGLAALSVLLSALRRAEPGLHAWPLIGPG